MTAVTPRRPQVRVLDIDPDLGADVDRQDWEAARRACHGVLLCAPAGRWELPPALGESNTLLGLLLVTGAVCREVRLRDRHLLELLGPGDLLQAPAAADISRISASVTLTPVLETRMLALGQSFIAGAAQWPSLLVAVAKRLEAQRERLATQALITHLSRAEHRLLLMLWHLADRWGVVTPAGIVLPLPLSHDILGQLSAARRSTATIAVTALEQAHQIKRLPDGSWLLTAAGEHAVAAIAATPEVDQSFGETLALRLRSREVAQSARALRAEAKLAREAREAREARARR